MAQDPNYLDTTRQQLEALGYVGDAQAEAARIVQSMLDAVQHQQRMRAADAQDALDKIRILLNEARDADYFAISGARDDADGHKQRATDTVRWLEELAQAWTDSLS